ncbi:MAG: FtsX-like permease family protein [Candidatus Heimdallarchaeota archaeon]
MGFNFYFKSALKNIRYGKKQSTLYTLGIVVAVTLLVSIRLWSSTAEDLAAQDFLTNQDYEIKFTSIQPVEIPAMIEWLSTDPVVQDIHELYYSLACFNAEDKAPNYRWSPEDQQEDMNDPISVTALGLWPKSSLERIESQFSVRGSFDLQLNEVLISEYEALELESVYGYSIEPGMAINLSVAKRSPELGNVLIQHFQLEHYFNVTVKGIYRSIPAISMLQKTFSASFLRDSVIFLRENLEDVHINIMEANGIQRALMIKTNIYETKKDGIGEILNKIKNLADRMELAFPTSFSIILEAPVLELQHSYSLAQNSIIFVVPVATISVILTIFTINIIIENRKSEIHTIKDRGGQKWQIISIILLEFLILTLIGLTVSIFLAFIVASFIPAIASGSFSGAVFGQFILEVIFPYSFTFYVALGTLFITNIFGILKILSVLTNDLEERQIMLRKRILNIVISILVGGLFVLIATLLIYTTIQSNRNTHDSYNFTLDQSKRSMLIFLLLILLIMTLATILTLFLDKIIGNLKRVYRKLFQKNSFFISNSLKRSEHKLTSILIVFLLVASINVFSLNIYTTINSNQKAEQYYNNGSDFRIQTSYVEMDYAQNISQIVGIKEAMPVLRVDALLVYGVTVYGVDPIAYSRIGRWDSFYSNQSEINQMLYALNQNDRGIIISDVTAIVNNRTIGDRIIIRGLPNTTTYQSFNITGIIHSAPGFGLADGRNIELNQPNSEFVIVNQRTLSREFAVEVTNLFFARVEDDYTVELIIQEIEALDNVIVVNPEMINYQYIGKYIGYYIPSVQTFLLIQIIIMNIISLVIIATNIEYVIKQRDQTNAILNSLGNPNANLMQMIISELMVIIIFSFVLALVIGIPFSLYSIKFNRAIFTTHNILPYYFAFDYIGIPIFLVSLLIISVLTTIPSLVRFTKQNIAIILKQ